MNELMLVNRNEIGVRAGMMETPLHLCMENYSDISGARAYGFNLTIKVEGVAFVKDAP